MTSQAIPEAKLRGQVSPVAVQKVCVTQWGHLIVHSTPTCLDSLVISICFQMA
jgi:hypothetical protein